MKKWLHFVFVDMTYRQGVAFVSLISLASCVWMELWPQAIFVLLARTEFLKFLDRLAAEAALEKAAGK